MGEETLLRIVRHDAPRAGRVGDGPQGVRPDSGGGFRHLSCNVRAIHGPQDLKGVKIRTTKSPMEFTLMKAWGAIPVPYDGGPDLQRMLTGVINGMYVQLPWQAVLKIHEVAEHFTLTGGAWEPTRCWPT